METNLNFLLYFNDSNRRIFWLYLLSSSILLMLWIFKHKKYKRVLFSKALWFNKSVKLDIYYFIFIFYVKAFIIFPFIISSKTVTLWIYHFMINNFGYHRYNADTVIITISYTFCLFVFSDLTRYILHRLLHEVPILWEFHKVHHSAKILNPLTFYRIHPVENILYGFRYAFSIGLISGIFLYFFGAKVDLVQFMGVNIFIFFFSLIGGNLRHTHVHLAFFKPLEYIFISPKMHQIHHDINNTNKNYGGYIAFWDYIFGSLKTSDEVKTLKFGLSKNMMKDYLNIKDMVVKPFEKIQIQFKNKNYKKRLSNIINNLKLRSVE